MTKTHRFRQWFRATEDAKEKIESMIDEGGYILFFKKDGDIFASGEDSRIVFSKLKNPEAEEDLPAGWEEEASFVAENMNKMIRGEPGQSVFYKKDIDEMKVIDRDKVIEELKKEAPADGPRKAIKFIDIRNLFKIQHDPDDAPNFVQANED
jgi:hypothetical protein